LVVGAYSTIQRTADARMTVADFTIAAAPAAQTVTGGQSATYTVTVEPAATRFSAPVELSCSGTPSGGSCSFSPPQLTPGTGPATSTLTLAPVALGGVGPVATPPDGSPPGGAPQPGPLLWLSLASGALLLGLGWRSRFARALGAACVVLVVGTLACGGDSTGPPDPVTTTFTVTGTSGALSHSASATVTVQ
jgi:hypothetical protein